MTREEIWKLKFGVYRVFWKSGGSSVASFGFDRHGERWLAPSNWIEFANNYEELWPKIDRMRLIELQEDDAHASISFDDELRSLAKRVGKIESKLSDKERMKP